MAQPPAPLFRDPIYDGAYHMYVTYIIAGRGALDLIDGRLVCDRDKPFDLDLGIME